MNVQELYELVGTGEQRRNVEIKRSMSWNVAIGSGYGSLRI